MGIKVIQINDSSLLLTNKANKCKKIVKMSKFAK